jgi:YidC/Oxa1 family membrane protein insertase|tara:strand:+ start:1261 stop:2976 length:1716 start_codon:yes stop_codon:yes gene_type:complete
MWVVMTLYPNLKQLTPKSDQSDLMDNTRLFLFAATAFVGMLIWQQWQVDYGPKPTVVVQKNNGEIAINSSNLDDLPEIDNQTSVSTTDLQNDTLQASASLITVETDVIIAVIDTQGGVIRSIKLKKYPVTLEDPNEYLELVHSDKDTVHILQSGLRNKANTAPTHHSLFITQKQNYTLNEGDKELLVPLIWRKDGVEVIKTFRFTQGKYLVDVQHKVLNNSGSDWQGSEYRQIQRTRPLSESKLINTYTGAVYYNEVEKYTKYSFDDMEDEQLKLKASGGWIAMIQHYFLSAWVPDQDGNNLVYSISSTKRYPSTYTIGMRSANKVVNNGASTEFNSQFFVGPKLVERLEEISPGLDLTVDYGVLTFLSKPLYWLLSFYHSYVGNWGLAIILLTFTIKAVFYKLSEASYRSMARMRKVAPRLKTLKERHGDDRQKMNQAMMELYKTEKINPMGGCLPMLVQIPVFIALYWALLETVALRQAPFILWIQDLSVMDPYYVMPVIMGISMFIQQRLNPAPPDPIQAKVMMALPFVFTIFFAFFPAGLVLYWIVNNTLSIAQQYVITKRIEAGGN